MQTASLLLVLLGVGSFALSTWLEPWYQSWAGNRTQSANVMAVALGDARRLFARHFYIKADIYFHRGYYPSIFDSAPASEAMHDAAQGGNEAEHHRDFLGQPLDWIDAFSRYFYPSRHLHLGEDPKAEHEHHADDGHHEEDTKVGKEAREILPWLRLSALLDAEQPQTYVVGAYWLRTQLGKVDEAERFLREGLQANPLHPELLLELGRIYRENRHDLERARNVWELALRKCPEYEDLESESGRFVYGQLLGYLAKVEESLGRYDRALDYLRKLRKVSPYKASIDKWMREVRSRQASKG